MSKRGNKAPPAAAAAAAAALSTQELFWEKLYGDDLQLARSTGCSCQADLDREKQKIQERLAKAQEAQKQTIRENERKRAWEKEQEKKNREKERDEKKWEKQLEAAKKQAFKEGVLEAHDWGDGVWWVQCEDKKWMEVQGQYFCPLCNKHLNDATLEAHIMSEAHKKKVAWYGGAAAGAALPAAAPRPTAAAPAPALAPRMTCTPVLPDWQQMGADGLVRCIPCNKVVDDNHISTGDHIRRLEAWQEHEQRKKTGYAPPALEYLCWMPSVSGDDNSERWLKCLLCQKWVQDETSHTGTQQNPAGSKDHQKNLRNYIGTPWYKEHVLKERLKWHPEPAVRTNPAAAPTTRAPWASAAPAAPPAPTYNGAPQGPPAWAMQSAVPVRQPFDDPWNTDEPPKQTQAPYPTSSATRLPSAEPAEVVEEEEEFDC